MPRVRSRLIVVRHKCIETSVVFVYTSPPIYGVVRFILQVQMSFTTLSAAEVANPLESFCVSRINSEKNIEAFFLELAEHNLCGWENSEPTRNDFNPKAIIQGNELVYVCRTGVKLIGYCRVALGKDEATLGLICAKFPGGSDLKLGVGSTLLRVAESAVRHRGYRSIRVPEALPSAESFYIRHGYIIQRKTVLLDLVKKLE